MGNCQEETRLKEDKSQRTRGGGATDGERGAECRCCVQPGRLEQACTAMIPKNVRSVDLFVFYDSVVGRVTVARGDEMTRWASGCWERH